MDKRYKTWWEFKNALVGKLNEDLPQEMWALLEELLFSSSIHEPYSNGDIDFALRKIKRLKRIKNWKYWKLGQEENNE